jgi:hypothetical protein
VCELRGRFATRWLLWLRHDFKLRARVSLLSQKK